MRRRSLRRAIKLNPLHASAQFGLARTLQRAGQADKSREHLKRFQEMTQAKIATPLSAVYGEQGRYATVEDMRSAAAAVGPMIPVTFAAAEGTGEPTKAASLPGEGAGMCLLDVEGKGRKDLLVAGEGESAIRGYSFEGGAAKEISLKESGLVIAGHGVSCAVGDYDNDGLPDVAVALTDRVALFHNLGKGKFVDVTEKVGIKALNKPAGLTFVDYDHDGDLDLYVTGSATGAGASVMWRNNGNSTFTEWTTVPGLAGNGSTVAAVLSDVNNDRAVDLVVTGSGASPTVYENQREGAFKQVALFGSATDAAMSPTRGVTILDFNKDGWMDVAVTHAGAPGLSLWRNVEGKSFERVPLPLADAKAAWGVTPIDFDNDGWIDLAVLVETAQGDRAAGAAQLRTRRASRM